jgi:hypothetical protein
MRKSIPVDEGLLAEEAANHGLEGGEGHGVELGVEGVLIPLLAEHRRALEHALRALARYLRGFAAERPRAGQGGKSAHNRKDARLRSSALTHSGDSQVPRAMRFWRHGSDSMRDCERFGSTAVGGACSGSAAAAEARGEGADRSRFPEYQVLGVAIDSLLEVPPLKRACQDEQIVDQSSDRLDQKSG